ncbi:MAG: hypothetical protein COA96_11245 [SAR86 cluster bacterium]|uniref:NIPSNAP domain-containing protein n=1 Tax=SAR86 cluster bacterium TaxID=2030880 RepID=A0A2A5AWT6_9GAMM|nr:MAG: hypothetical protein COA96_11245 [SAR86 cluster bacterium]
MRVFIGKLSVRQFLALVCFFLPAFIYAQSSVQSAVMQNYTFSYSIVEAETESVEFFELARNEILSKAPLNGGIIYALWMPAEKSADAPFAGLSVNQMGLMLAWPNDALQQVDALNQALQSIDSVATVSTRLFEAIYLPAGLSVPTMGGFYVHREAKYKLEDVDEAVRLSIEAWETWEPHWGVTVIGLFRELGITADFANLNRIVWYPSYDAWRATRNNDDVESANRFRQRRGLRIPDSDSGIAIATDRILP